MTVNKHTVNHILSLIKILSVCLAFLLFACRQNSSPPEKYDESRELVPNPEGYKKDTFMVASNNPTPTNCNFYRFLNHPETPKAAIELFNNKNTLKSDPTLLLDKLKSNDANERKFYVKALTNSYEIADGAFAEGLGNAGKEFIENNTNEFASYFDDTLCFNAKDLKTWARIVQLEFDIIANNSSDKTYVGKYSDQLKKNCIDCSAQQKATIEKFTILLKTH